MVVSSVEWLSCSEFVDFNHLDLCYIGKEYYSKIITDAISICFNFFVPLIRFYPNVIMRVILSALSLLSTLVLAQTTVSRTVGSTTATISSATDSQSTAKAQTTVPLFNILHDPSGNTTYTPQTYYGRVLKTISGNTVYAISCLRSFNTTVCGKTPFTVTQGPHTFVHVDAMTTTLPLSTSSNMSVIARPTGTALRTMVQQRDYTFAASSSLSCSLCNSSAICVNRMVFPDHPTTSPPDGMSSVENTNRTVVLKQKFAKKDIVWDVLVITTDIGMVNTTFLKAVNGSSADTKPNVMSARPCKFIAR